MSTTYPPIANETMDSSSKRRRSSSRSPSDDEDNVPFEILESYPEAGPSHLDPGRSTSANRPKLLSSASQIFTEGDTTGRRFSSAQRGRITRKEEVWKKGIVVGGLIVSWYFFSMLISVYNKWMFDPKKRNFPYPVFVTSLHMVVQFSLSSLIILILDRPSGRVVVIPRTPEGKKRRPTTPDWLSKVFPCALASALDIGLSNTSLKSISLTLYTMCKSSNLVFVLLFAFLFRLERLRWSLVGIIAVITIGVIMMVSAETELVILGAVQVLLASAMGGLRWALTQLLLEKERLGLTNPVSAIFWLCPPMAVLLFSTSLIVEDWHGIVTSSEFHGGFVRLLKTLGLLTFPGGLAFCMSLSEYALIQRTSVVTLSVAGIFKEILTVILASTIFDDQLTPVNITGLCIAIAGIAGYNYIKFKSLEQGGAVGGKGRDVDTGAYQPVQTEDGEETTIFERHSVDATASHDAAEPSKPLRGKSRLELQAEEAKRKRREEEADMEGWGSSGFQVSADGFFDDDDPAKSKAAAAKV